MVVRVIFDPIENFHDLKSDTLSVSRSLIPSCVLPFNLMLEG